jgi:hypothetical protein
LYGIRAADPSTLRVRSIVDTWPGIWPASCRKSRSRKVPAVVRDEAARPVALATVTAVDLDVAAASSVTSRDHPRSGDFVGQSRDRGIRREFLEALVPHSVIVSLEEGRESRRDFRIGGEIPAPGPARHSRPDTR